MEKSKSKIHEALKKVSSLTSKSGKFSPAKSPIQSLNASKKKSAIPSKVIVKANFANNPHTISLKKYGLNKTVNGSAFDKSVMNSYMTTPNENSMIAQNKGKQTQAISKVSSKTREVFCSTEDENMSDGRVGVQFWIGKKKLGVKSYYGFEPVDAILKDMSQKISQLKEAKEYIALIGIDPMPYSHGIKVLLSNKKKTFSDLLSRNIKDLSVQPILIQQTPNFDQLKLSDFQLLQCLGSGGFSTVYLAKCEIDKRLCALKFIKKQSITSEKKAKMLENEKDILFAIDSPHLVDLLHSFETENYFVFGLEYCENGNLYNFLQHHKKIPQNDARILIQQILSGLEYLHQNNILFRDLKLENLLFDENGNLKITDFGLSKPEVSGDNVTYSYCGSPEYMAPEMLAKCGHSFQVDYYALGILLYEMMYGVSPFYAPKREEIFHAIMNSEPKFPKQPIVSKQGKQLIKGLLIKNPVHRIGSLKGVKEIKSHPWFRMNQAVHKSSLFDFPYKNLKLSAKQMKQLRQYFHHDMIESNFHRILFPRSFVNKQIINDLASNMIVFSQKKEKPEKMIRANIQIQKSNKLL